MKIIESPRDAMKGLSQFIPTQQKAEFINALLKVGFHTIDFGSFVSENSAPQSRDTEEVLKLLDLTSTSSALQVHVNDVKSTKKAISFDQISYLSCNFTVSNTLAQLNKKTSVEELFEKILVINELCHKNNKTLVIKLSAAFGNPYGDNSSVDEIAEWFYKFDGHGIRTVQLTDSTGEATPENITHLFGNLTGAFPKMEIGLHLHTEPHLYIEKVHAAYSSGCVRFDTVINGMGGCSMSDNKMIGNLRTGSLISYLERHGSHLALNRMAFLDAVKITKEIFPFATPTIEY